MCDVSGYIVQLVDGDGHNIYPKTRAENIYNGENEALDSILSKKSDSGHTHTAEQVHARPDTWMPTADDVGAAASDHTHTAAQVGALSTIGGNLTGPLTAGGAQDAGTAQVRNIVISTAEPLGVGNGTIWLQYEEAGA